MNRTKALAHKTGALYLLFSIIAVIGEFLFPTFVVPGDPTATAGNIAAGEFAYRMSILTSLATLVIFILLVVMLYKLLADVDKMQAMLMVLLVAVGVAVAFANLLMKFSPLVFLGNADALSALSQPQLDALAFAALRSQSTSAAVVTTFWGLWLFPFGYLVIKSRMFPRILGYLLIVAGIGYLITGLTNIVLPDYRSAVARFMMPLYFGEVVIVFWLLIKGAKAPQVAS